MQPLNNSTVLAHMILNGKGWLTGDGPHGYSLVSVLFQKVDSICSCFLKNIYFALCIVISSSNNINSSNSSKSNWPVK